MDLGSKTNTKKMQEWATKYPLAWEVMFGKEEGKHERIIAMYPKTSTPMELQL